MFKKIGALALAGLLYATGVGLDVAGAQGLFSFQLPGQSVVGNPRILPGPGAAIPFSTFSGLILNSSGSTGSQLNVVSFGADSTGVNDSTTNINNAINALPATGGNVRFPCGIYKISGTIRLGNGTNGVQSTRSGMVLVGDGVSLLPTEGGAFQTPCVLLSWAGSAGGTMVEVDGILQGWGIQNIAFQCGASSPAGFGLHNISGQFGDSRNLSFANCTSESLGSTTWTTLPAGFTSVNALHNYYSNVTITVPNVSNAIGMALRGDTSNPLKSDTAYDEYHNFKFVMPNTGALTTRGLYIGPSDSSYFTNFHFVGGVAQTVEITFDYSQTGAAAFPQGHVFVGLDPSGSLVPPIRFQAIGTQTGGFPNYIYGLNQINGAIFPGISGLCAAGSGVIQLCGQVSGIVSVAVQNAAGNWNFQLPTTAGTAGQVLTSQAGGLNAMTWTNLAAAWAGFTATPTCGTATITTTSARFSTSGKTTFIMGDFTITALGSCTTAFTFSMPVNSNESFTLPFQETANTGVVGTCRNVGAGSTASCQKNGGAVYGVNDRIIFSGVYENQ